jgi:hypothetical protein
MLTSDELTTPSPFRSHGFGATELEGGVNVISLKFFVSSVETIVGEFSEIPAAVPATATPGSDITVKRYV